MYICIYFMIPMHTSTFTCVCRCMYVCVLVCEYLPNCLYVYLSAHASANYYMNTYTFAHVNTHVYISTYICHMMCIFLHTRRCLYVCANIYAYVHAKLSMYGGTAREKNDKIFRLKQNHLNIESLVPIQKAPWDLKPFCEYIGLICKYMHRHYCADIDSFIAANIDSMWPKMSSFNSVFLIPPNIENGRTLSLFLKRLFDLYRALLRIPFALLRSKVYTDKTLGF